MKCVDPRAGSGTQNAATGRNTQATGCHLAARQPAASLIKVSRLFRHPPAYEPVQRMSCVLLRR